MALTAPSFTVNFNADVESADFGKLVLTDTTDYAGEGIADADVIGYFNITYPDGTFHIGNFTTPDIDGGTSFVFDTLSIPTDANGDLMEGTYSFSYYIRVSGAVQPGDYEDTGNTYNFCPCLVPASLVEPIRGAVADIEESVNCFCLKIEATDNTDVCVPTTNSVVMSLYPPPSLGLATYTTSSSTLVYNFMYSGGYEIQVNRILTYVSGIFTYTIRVKSSIYFIVQCDRDLCSLTNCFNTYRSETLTKAGQYGGFFNLPKAELDLWMRITAAFVAHDNNLRCGNYEEAGVIFNELKTLLKCNCSCNDDDTPRLINPYCSGSGSNNSITIVAAGAGITISAVVVGDTTTYTVAVQQATLDQIAENTTNITNLTTIVNNILAGSTGNNYRLIENDTSNVGTDANLLEKTLISETLTAGLLAGNGDCVKLRAFFILAGNANAKTCRVYFGAAVVEFTPTPPLIPTLMEMGLEITRTGAATQITTTWANLAGLPADNFGPATGVGTEVLAGAILTKMTGQNGVATANDIISNRYVVEYYKKA